MTIQGELTGHWHAGTGEFVLVPARQLTIQKRDRNVVLAPRELFAVPRRRALSAGRDWLIAVTDHDGSSRSVRAPVTWR